MQGTHSISLNSETYYLLALQTLKGVGPVTARKLISHFGKAESIFKADKNELSAFALKNTIIEQIVHFDDKRLNSTLEWLEKPEHHLITQETPFYPALLSEIGAPPLVLFTIGNLELLSSPQIAVVGSRSPTSQGSTNTQQFVQALCEAGFTITSGLATGIDGEAHRAALSHGGNTIAVIGTAPDRIYPAHHRELTYQIARKGLVISERLPGTPFDRGAFPSRNRIIAGLSLGTLVVEAAEKSGTLITANHSMEQGREVFAIPGSIHNPQSKGCHKLIKQGAKLVETVEDIIEDIPCYAKGHLKLNDNIDTRPQLNTEDIEFLSFIDFDITPVDTIVRRSQLTVEAVTNKLLTLELQGWVINSAGGYIRQ